jgi:four helix bundle protein
MTKRGKKMIKSYEDLEVFQKAYDISLELHKLSLRMPEIEQFSLAQQLRKSSKSICANLAEGFGKQSHSKQEFKRYLSICIGSADETKIWLKYAKDLEYINSKEYEELTQEYTNIAKMLSGLYKSWG